MQLINVKLILYASYCFVKPLSPTPCLAAQCYLFDLTIKSKLRQQFLSGDFNFPIDLAVQNT